MTSSNDIKDISRIVAGCFDKESNFEKELKSKFETEQELKAILFEIKGVILEIEKEKATVGEIHREFRKKLVKKD